MMARRALILGVGVGLGACNFRPLLLDQAETEGGDPSVRTELEAVEIDAPEGRLGWLVRNALLDELNPYGTETPSRYVLDIELRSTASALGIQLDSTITRFNLTLTAIIRLRQKGETAPLYSAAVRRIASYNVSRQPYADLIASQTAERRAAKLVSSDIRTQLAVHFARQARTT